MRDIWKYAALTCVVTSSLLDAQYANYKVKRGDTLYGIAFKNGMSVNEFLKLNKIGNPDKYNLKVGEIVKIKALKKENAEYALFYDTTSKTYALKKIPENDKISAEKPLNTYTVKNGDTLYGIAFENDMKVNDFLKINNIADPLKYNLTVGEKLKVYETSEIKKKETVIKKEEKLSSDKALKTYVVKNGDTLYGIAFENDMRVNDFLKVNNITDSLNYKLTVGQKLKIYENITPDTQTKTVETYIVKNGDTLSEIANKSSMSLRDLYSINNINSKYVLKIGDKIKVYSKSYSKPESYPKPEYKKMPYRTVETYKVKKGDTLSEIAVAQNMDLVELYSLNNINEKYILKEGDDLKVYALDKPKTFIYTVKKGDTLYSIARNHKIDLKDLLKINNIANANTYKLKIGEKLNIKILSPSPVSTSSQSKIELPPSSFIWPYKGIIVAGYGVGVDKLANRGINISGDIGDNIVASDTGIVEYVNKVRGFGIVIILKHKNGYNSTYAHLSATDVNLGDTVSKGSVIGRIGNTGFINKSELYFKISYQGRPIDPIKLLPRG